MATLSAVCAAADRIQSNTTEEQAFGIDLTLYSLLSAACEVFLTQGLSGTWMKRPLTGASGPNANSTSNVSSCTADNGDHQHHQHEQPRKKFCNDAGTPVTDVSTNGSRQLSSLSLVSLPWVQDLISHQGFSVALDKATGLVPGGGFFPMDHLFCALATTGQIHDLLVLLRAAPPNPSPAPDNCSRQQPAEGFTPEGKLQKEQQQDVPGSMTAQQHVPAAAAETQQQQAEAAQPSAPPATHSGAAAVAAAPPPPVEVVAAFQVGKLVAGHAGIVHGGLTAAMIDETFGYLLYMGRASAVLSFSAVLTANLKIDYLLPLPTNSTAVITARIKRIEGRKIFVEAELGDQPLITPAAEAPGDRDGTATGHSPAQTPGKVYAKGNALFIIPRQGGTSDHAVAAGVAAAKAAAPPGASVALWQQPAGKETPAH